MRNLVYIYPFQILLSCLNRFNFCVLRYIAMYDLIVIVPSTTLPMIKILVFQGVLGGTLSLGIALKDFGPLKFFA